MSIARFLSSVVLAAAVLTAQDGNSGNPAKPGNPAEASAKGTAAPAVVRAPAVTVGVVNLDKAIETYPRWIKMKADLAAMKTAFDDRLTAMSKPIRELKAVIDSMEEGTEARRQKELAHSLMLQEQKGQAEILREQLDLEIARSQVAVFEDLEVAIAKVAKARGVDLVLRQREIPKAADIAALSARSVQARIGEFERKSVLYSADSLDLTQDVVKLLMVPLENGKPAEGPKSGGQ